MEDAQRETGETGETGDTWEQTWYLSKLLHKLAHLETSYLKKTSIWSQIISRNSSNSTDPLPSVSATLDGHQMVIVVIKIVKWLWLCQRWSNIAMDRYDNLLSRLLAHCICLCLWAFVFCICLFVSLTLIIFCSISSVAWWPIVFNTDPSSF